MASNHSEWSERIVFSIGHGNRYGVGTCSTTRDSDVEQTPLLQHGGLNSVNDTAAKLKGGILPPRKAEDWD